MRVPALNELQRREGKEPEFPDNSDDLRYMILYDTDHQGYGSDVSDNVAVLLNEENAREVKRLAEKIIDQLEDE